MISSGNALLGPSYQLYRHSGTNEKTLRTLCSVLRPLLHGRLQTVVPTTYIVCPPVHRWLTQRKRSSEEAAGLEGAASEEPMTVLSILMVTSFMR